MVYNFYYLTHILFKDTDISNCKLPSLPLLHRIYISLACFFTDKLKYFNNLYNITVI